MPSSAEYWSINGVSLHEYGWSVATVGGSRYDLPPRRGSNIVLAKRPGQVHRNKTVDARTIDLIMWCLGVDPTTGNASPDPTLQWNNNWDYLRRAVWHPLGSTVDLTRRWYLTVDSVKTLVTATAQAEIADSMAPSMTGRHRAEFTMRLLLADPFFYGPEIVETFSVGETISVLNAGHDIAAYGNFHIDLVGPLTNPRLTNTSFEPDVYVQFNMAIPSGVTIRLSVPDFTARTIEGYEITGVVNLTTNVTHSGARFWMGLYPGINSLTLSGSGGGTAVLRYRAPYI